MIKRGIFWLSVNIYFVVSILIFFELVLQIRDFHYVPLALQGSSKTNILGAVTDREINLQSKDEFTPDPLLIWRPKPNTDIFNSQGFRGEVLSAQKPPSEYRIFAIGDSNTLGAPDQPWWVDYLGQKLKKDNQNIKVVNAGVWGYSSYQGLNRFKEILRYQPDMVLVSFGANDAHAVVIDDQHYIASKRFFNSTMMQFRLGQLLYWFTDYVMYKNIRPETVLTRRVNINLYKDNLISMVKLAQANNIKVILLTRPYFKEAGWNPPPILWIAHVTEYNNVVSTVGRTYHVPIIDISAKVSNQDKYFIDNSHYNNDGNIAAADFLYKDISKLLP